MLLLHKAGFPAFVAHLSPMQPRGGGCNGGHSYGAAHKIRPPAARERGGGEVPCARSMGAEDGCGIARQGALFFFRGARAGREWRCRAALRARWTMRSTSVAS
eukprot:6208866-Pleurochrysis_carterae.AAC.1